jgi:hypothetical protein
MVIDVVCGPIAYKTQILAYHLRRKPIVDFAMPLGVENTEGKIDGRDQIEYAACGVCEFISNSTKLSILPPLEINKSLA